MNVPIISRLYIEKQGHERCIIYYSYNYYYYFGSQLSLFDLLGNQPFFNCSSVKLKDWMTTDFEQYKS